MKKIVVMAVLFICCLFGIEAFAQTQKVVVVPLESNKIKKQQTLNYNFLTLQFPAGQAAGSNGGCITNSADGSPGFIPLTLPLGAKIISVFVDVFDDASATVYQVMFGRSIAGASNLSSTQISSIAGGSKSNQIIKENLSPATPETVDAGESFYLFFAPGGTTANGFCGAQVTVELP